MICFRSFLVEKIIKLNFRLGCSIFFWIFKSLGILLELGCNNVFVIKGEF